jgi:hypothetical protein
VLRTNGSNRQFEHRRRIDRLTELSAS